MRHDGNKTKRKKNWWANKYPNEKKNAIAKMYLELAKRNKKKIRYRIVGVGGDDGGGGPINRMNFFFFFFLFSFHFYSLTKEILTESSSKKKKILHQIKQHHQRQQQQHGYLIWLLLLLLLFFFRYSCTNHFRFLGNTIHTHTHFNY